ncbi:MAG: hypothetical protein FWE54_04585 [Methanimicrococcus sp.]|nr:hypothetical protein [Methanimicrococcus sp.]
MSTSTAPNATSRINLKKRMPFVIAAVLILTLFLGFAAQASTAPVCEIIDTDGSTVLQQYIDLADALDDVLDGQTIRLLNSVDYNQGIEIYGKVITFEVGDYILNVTSDTTYALYVEDGGVLLDSVSGELNLISTASGYSGLYVWNTAYPHDPRFVTVVTNTEGDHSGAYVVNSHVKVLQDAKGTYRAGMFDVDSVVEVGNAIGGYYGVESFYSFVTVDNAIGDHAGVIAGHSTITVGNATGRFNGISAGQNSIVTVTHDVTSDYTGVYATSGGKVTVDGIISHSGAANEYVVTGSNRFTSDDGDYVGSSKPGYFEFTDGTSSVWVKKSAAVCEILETGVQYADFADALNDVLTGQTIRLLEDIDYNQNILITGKSITFDVGDFNLNVTSSTTNALNVTDGGVALSAGSGEFNVVSTAMNYAGVRAQNSVVEVSHAAGDIGVAATNSTVTVYNGVVSSSQGVVAEFGSKIYIDGILSHSGIANMYVVLMMPGGIEFFTKGDGDYTGSSEPGYLEYAYNTNYVWIKAFVCEIVETGVQYYDLTDALADVQDGQTIRLLVDIDYNQNIHIFGKSITFDIGDFYLNVTSATMNALDVENGGVALSAGSGEFNVVSTAIYFAGAWAMDSVVEVSHATGYTGVYSWNSTVTVYNDATGDGTGVSAVLGSTVTVYNDVTGGIEGVHARTSIVTVYNDVTGGDKGVVSAAGSRVYIDGIISHSGADDRYVVLDNVSLSYLRKIDNNSAGSTVPDYLEYTDGTNFVWVKAPAVFVCEIVDTDGSTILQQYTDLADALVDVLTGQTIRLLGDIDYNQNIIISGKSITFDVGDYILNATSSTTHALNVTNGGVALSAGSGEFNVAGTSAGSYGVRAINSSVEVSHVSAGLDGVHADNSTVTVYNDVTGGPSGRGVDAKNSIVTVHNDVSGGRTGVYAANSTVTVHNDVSGGSTGVVAEDSTVTVHNDVAGGSTGRGVDASNSTVTVHNDVSGGSIGVDVGFGSKIYIDGILSHSGETNWYVLLYNGTVVFLRQIDNNSAGSTVPGYLEYTDGTNFVWVKAPPVFVCEIVDTDGSTVLQQYTDLAGALSDVLTGQTIRLLEDIYYNQGITITDKSITFDVGDFNLNVTTSTTHALNVTNGGVALSAGTGEFNVISTVSAFGGVQATNSVVEVSHAAGGMGVNAGNSTVTVNNDATGTYNGVNAFDSTVTVYNDVKGSIGVLASNSTVIVKNDVTGGTNGVHALAGSKIYIDGVLSHSGADNRYVVLVTGVSAFLRKIDNNSVSSVPGYLEYTDGTNYVWVKAPAVFVCEIVDTDGSTVLQQYTDLAGALADVLTGQTIRLLEDIDYNQGIEITDKSITFDVGDFNLNVTTSTTHALNVTNGGVALSAGTGEFNVISTATGFAGLQALNSVVEISHAMGDNGVFADNSTVTVYNDVTGFLSDGVFARDSTVTVYNDVTGYLGVNAGSSTVTVHNNATGSFAGVVGHHSIITVYNDVTGGAIGAAAETGSKIYIDGILSHSGADNRYVVLIVDTIISNLSRSDNNSVSSEPGYLEYTDGTNFVWVKAPAVFVCEIIGIDGVTVLQQYTDLGDALTDVQDGETIKLLVDIDYDTGILVHGISITFDVTDFVLNVTYDNGNALRVETGGEVNLIDGGTGEFNVICLFTSGSAVSVSSGKAAVTNVISDGLGVHAIGATVTVSGDITGTGNGVSANLDSTVSVDGNVTSSGPRGIDAGNNTSVTVGGDVASEIFASFSTTVNVGGDVTSGVSSSYSATVNVDGDVVNSGGSFGVNATNGGVITVLGSVTGGTFGVLADNGFVTVNSDVSGSGFGVNARNSIITVHNNVTSGSEGVWVENSTVTVHNDVMAGYHGVVALNSTVVIYNDVEGGPMGQAVGARNSTVTVHNNVTGGLYGVFANDSTITVSGGVINNDFGVSADNSTVNVGGDVESNDVGLRAENESEVTVDGIITVPSGRTYIEINSVSYDIGDYSDPSSKSGYLEYTDTDSFVWVMAIAAVVCEIVDIDGVTVLQEYTDLADALDDVLTGQTIRLLTSIDYNQGISISGKFITFDVGDYILNVTSSTTHGMNVTNGGVALSADTGELNVVSTELFSEGVRARNSSVEVSNAAGTAAGVHAGLGSIVTVYNDATGANEGVHANNSTVTVNNDVKGVFGVVAENSTVVVKNDVTGTIGVVAAFGSTVTVYNDVTGLFSDGVSARDSTVTVKNDVKSGAIGVEANNSTVTVNNDVASGATGVKADNSTVTVENNVTSTFSHGVVADSSTVTVNNSVKGSRIGVDALNSTVTVSDDVTGIVGVDAIDSTVTVSNNVTGSADGVFALNSTVIVHNDVKGGDIGVYAEDSTVTVHNDVSGGMFGVEANNSTVTVYNNVTSDEIGVVANDGGKIYIDGILSHSGAANEYVILYDGNVPSYFERDDGDYAGSTVPGYLEYTDDVSYVWIKAFVCEIVETGVQYYDLGDALGDVLTGQTIKLLVSFDYNQGITIIGKSITFDVGDYILTVTSDTTDALEVVNGGVALSAGSGELNVISTATDFAGVNAMYSNVEVSNAAGDSIGVFAYDSTVTVHNDATGSIRYGVFADDDSTVIVHNNAAGGIVGVVADNSTVIVYNDVTGGTGGVVAVDSTVTVNNNVTGVITGVTANDGSKIYIDGILSHSGAANEYVILSDGGVYTTIKKDEGIFVGSTVPGYLEYTDGTNFVWVKAFVCEIVETGVRYHDLADALDDVLTGQTIKLLVDLDYNSGIFVDDIKITFDVTGYVFNVTSTQGDALEVTGAGGEVNLIDGGTGEFNVICRDSSKGGVNATAGGNAMVTNVMSDGFGVYANRASVTVSGNVTGAAGGVSAELDSVISVGGDVASSGSRGVAAGNSSSVTIGGNVTGDVAVYYGAIADIGGDVTNSSGSHGVHAFIDATVTVGGNVTGNMTGVWATGNSFVDVVGDVTGNGIGVQAEDSIVDVGGDVTGNNIGVQAIDSIVSVDGDVTSNDIGLNAHYSLINVGGDVTGDSAGVYLEFSTVNVGGDAAGNDVGVYAGGSFITVNGNVTGDNAGVHADNSTVNVGGDVTSIGIGIGVLGINSIVNVDGDVTGEIGAAVQNSTVNIGGDVTGTDIGVLAENDSMVTIDGIISMPIDTIYIELNGTAYFIDDNNVPSSKQGYLEYTDGDSFVWVKAEGPGDDNGDDGRGGGPGFGNATIRENRSVDRPPVTNEPPTTSEPPATSEPEIEEEEEEEEVALNGGKSWTWLWLLLLLLLLVLAVFVYMNRQKIQKMLK